MPRGDKTGPRGQGAGKGGCGTGQGKNKSVKGQGKCRNDAQDRGGAGKQGQSIGSDQ